MSFLKEFLEFLKENKKLWLIPLLVVLLGVGGLLIVAKSSALAPLIYTLF
ncbi:MAG: hypothetical protein JNJ49_13295 [Bdellovibrionaceae bacterium]|nr:hypothetical protein [Pseudobdellovibrionaceae bacterium]